MTHLHSLFSINNSTIITLFSAWILLASASLWTHQQQLGLSRRMVLASLRGLLQLLALALVLHWIFDIQHPAVQAALIAAFCLIAAITSSEHHPQRRQAWLAAALGLMAGCIVTLPWLAVTGAIHNETRSLIPLGSMIAANGMNAISIMYERMQDGDAKAAIRTALIPPIDTLRVVGLVHMPGIFVGMVLAGSPPIAAASAQLVVLYMIVTSSLTACLISRWALQWQINKA